MSSVPHQTVGWSYDSDGDSSCNSSGGGKYGGHRCFACGKRGHFARSCPQRGASSSYDSDGDNPCNISGGGGGGGGGFRRCFSCGEAGHIARNCLHCYSCNQRGHFARDCPKYAGGGRGRGRGCYNCGEFGHLMRNCTSYCHHCGERGHRHLESCQRSGGSESCNGSWDTAADLGVGAIARMASSSSSNQGGWDVGVLSETPTSLRGSGKDKTLSDHPLMDTRIQPSSSNVGYLIGGDRALLGSSSTVTETQSSCTSNEGDKDKTLSDQPLMATRIQPSSSNAGYLNGDDGALLGSSSTATETQSSWFSNEGDKDKTLSDQLLMATRMQLSASKFGDMINALLGSSSTATETQSSCSSNEGDKDKTLYDQPLMATRIQPSSSNVGYLNGGDKALPGSSSTATETQSSCSSNEGDKDLYDQPLMATRIQPSSSNVVYNNKAFSARAPIIIEISSSSSCEGEDDDDDDDDYYDDDDEDEWEEVEEEEEADVGKHIPSLVVRVKTEKWSQKEVGDDDCCILDFNPFERPTIQFKHKLSLSVEHPSMPQDDDISIIAEKGQVACRDYPHSRHLCGNLPFENTSHESYCPQCYCYVCDMIAPCAMWNGNLGHCHATDLYDGWKLLRSSHLMKTK